MKKGSAQFKMIESYEELKMKSNPAFVFVVGFGLSGIGKGTLASSLGLLLKGYGMSVTAIKIDPYLNVDPGTISPHEHGEVYVLADGSETDLDLGNYERFMGIDLCRSNSITTGQIYNEVIRRERAGDYLGKTVQIVPHITDHIEERLLEASRIPGPDGKKPDVVIVELGGTIGDIEGEPFLHAISQFGARNEIETCVIGIGLVIRNNGELKTKPLQHAVKELRRHSILPDILCVRCDVPNNEFPEALREKIASSCNVRKTAVFVSGKVGSIYEVPNLLRSQGMHEFVCRKLGLLWRGTLETDFKNYNNILNHIARQSQLPAVRVAIIAKYTGSPDTYLSLIRALEHASFELEVRLEFEYVDAEMLEGKSNTEIDTTLSSFDKILVPGGFGNRGVEGKMCAIRYARRTKTPYFGICLGMQLFVVDHCRTVLGLTDANSTEFDPKTLYPVVQHLSEYGDELVKQLGGTMKVGNQQTLIETGSVAFNAYYSTSETIERHRHRYEVSPYFVEKVYPGQSSLRITGWAKSSLPVRIPDIVESTDWWAVGCQYHPEFISRNNRAHPLFISFLSAKR